jgi:hypothetical protein
VNVATRLHTRCETSSDCCGSPTERAVVSIVGPSTSPHMVFPLVDGPTNRVTGNGRCSRSPSEPVCTSRTRPDMDHSAMITHSSP